MSKEDSKDITRRINLVSTRPPTPFDNNATVEFSGGIQKLAVTFKRAKKLVETAGFENFSDPEAYTEAELREMYPKINWQLISGANESNNRNFIMVKAFHSYSFGGENCGVLVARICIYAESGNMAFIHLGDEVGQLTVNVAYNLDDWLNIEIKDASSKKAKIESGEL